MPNGTSPSSRRAWIEIGESKSSITTSPVALLAEGVDRNNIFVAAFIEVPRSPSSRRAWIEIGTCSRRFLCPHVALLAEGVDRNSRHRSILGSSEVALLAEGVDRNRSTFQGDPKTQVVALLAEGVDRNIQSSGRGISHLVALLAEGVDRNFWVCFCCSSTSGRPPRGVRG